MTSTSSARASSYWNPYFVGAAIGVLSWVVFVVVNKPLGMSTQISELSALAATPILGREVVEANPYWLQNAPAFNYGTLFLFGTFLGALLSAVVSKSFRFETVPEVWRARFGAAPLPRMIMAFIGGVLAMFGARLAGGCTSGHGISGTLQLAVSSWVFFVVMFVSGIVTAQIVFSRRA